MAESSKKRERTEEDVADNHNSKPALKKSKLDTTGKAEVTKKSSKLKEAKPEPAATEETSKPKKDKKEKKEKKDKKDKKERKEKKRKSKDSETVAEPDKPAPAAPSDPVTQTEEPTIGDATTTDNKSKKKNKKTKEKKTKSTEPTLAKEEEQEQEGEAEAAEDQENTNSGKPARFICFVGNLPYTATADSVRAHFSTLQPTSVRLLTQRDDPRKSRGIAFVEFGRYDHMKTCLKKFHHTEFDDGGKSPARRINVELTAGGGGKTAARQDKIKQKNAKLNEERANRMQREEEEAKLKKEGKTAEGGQAQEQRDEDAIHPSRRARVPYGRN
ncbi:hypothetical protein N658DRAFT_353317 [Parathielavia hyrcaniae]|uniref:RRM domain-containing protein n=1 Tax=Parathielavia hyrcaniae TaxID=113614 RepID=A0AAN6T1Y8_9PEZI|nr:hypothetical protein N658DRAFT_353317 [Parathielavia hyrcaniae]